MLYAIADGRLNGSGIQFPMPLVVEIDRRSSGGGGRRGGYYGSVGCRRRRHILQRRKLAGREINTPELLDQLEDIAGCLSAKLIQHPRRKGIERFGGTGLGAAALKQFRKPALEKGFDLTPRQWTQPHRKRAETFDAIADGAIDPF